MKFSLFRAFLVLVLMLLVAADAWAFGCRRGPVRQAFQTRRAAADSQFVQYVPHQPAKFPVRYLTSPGTCNGGACEPPKAATQATGVRYYLAPGCSGGACR